MSRELTMPMRGLAACHPDPRQRASGLRVHLWGIAGLSLEEPLHDQASCHCKATPDRPGKCTARLLQVHCARGMLDLVPACLQEHSCDSSPAGGNRASEGKGWLAEDAEEPAVSGTL